VGYFNRKDIVQQRRTSVNPDKTGLVAFTRKRKFPGFFKPQFLGVILSILGSVKYLGVILDYRLNWREDVEVKLRKAHNLLRVCRGRAGLGGVGSEIQDGPLALRRHLSADHLLCVLSMVVLAVKQLVPRRR